MSTTEGGKKYSYADSLRNAQEARRFSSNTGRPLSSPAVYDQNKELIKTLGVHNVLWDVIWGSQDALGAAEHLTRPIEAADLRDMSIELSRLSRNLRDAARILRTQGRNR